MRNAIWITAVLAAALAPPLAAGEKPVLVVYDFTSAFDKGATGQWVAEIVRGHAQRSGRYVGNPRITVDEVLAAKDFHPTAETAPEELAKFTREAFGADLFVYGAVDQAGLGYKVRFRVFRASKDGAAEKVLDETRECPAKQFVPLAVDDVLNAAAGVKDWRAEWTALAAELKRWSADLDPGDPDKPLVTETYRARQAAWQDALTARYRNVTARSNADFASKALLAYVKELNDKHAALMGALAAGKRDDAAAKALSTLADCCARSIAAWLDDAAAEKRWADGKSLVINGDFEAGQPAGGGPANWEPLKAGMSWAADPDGKAGQCVKFDVPEDVAATTGAFLYSQAFDVEEGATYRLRWRFRTAGASVKLFVKGYDEFPKEFGFEAQDREVWRSRKDPQHRPELKEYELGQWTEYGHDFVPFVAGPRRARYVRLMLYAYWPKGIVYWDDIVVKKIKDAPIRPK